MLDVQQADEALRPGPAVPPVSSGPRIAPAPPGRHAGAGYSSRVFARALSKAAAACASLLAIPLVLLVRLLRPLVLVRFGPLPSYRIGAFAFDPEVYVCERKAGLRGRRVLDLFYCPQPVCNRQLQRMWSRVLWVGGFARALERANGWLPGGACHQIVFRRPHGRDLHDVLARTPPHLTFTREEQARGWKALKALGIEPATPYIGFQARDQAYLEVAFPDRDWNYHTYRNVDIRTMLPAMEELARRGYLGVRMGAVVKEALPTAHPRLIDYSMRVRTEFLDIFLMAHCRFFLSDPSGIIGVPMIFRRPVAVVDLVPFEFIHSWGPQDVSIPKLFWLRSERRWMTFREILASGVGRFHWTEEYERHGIEVIENTPEEITAVAVEMDERLKGTWQTTPEDEALQRRFWSLFASSDLHGVIRSRIGAEFLRRHQGLLT